MRQSNIREYHSGVGTHSQRRRRERIARSKHRTKYWKRHDKETYECPDCGRGVTEVDQLDVHHKDENPLNGAWSNLIGLCHRCHLARHGREYDPQSLEDWKDGFLNLNAEA